MAAGCQTWMVSGLSLLANVFEKVNRCIIYLVLLGLYVIPLWSSCVGLYRVYTACDHGKLLRISPSYAEVWSWWKYGMVVLFVGNCSIIYWYMPLLCYLAYILVLDLWELLHPALLMCGYFCHPILMVRPLVNVMTSVEILICCFSSIITVHIVVGLLISYIIGSMSFECSSLSFMKWPGIFQWCF